MTMMTIMVMVMIVMTVVMTMMTMTMTTMLDSDKEHLRSFALGPRAPTFASRLVEFLVLDDLGSSSAYFWRKQGQAVDGRHLQLPAGETTNLPWVI